MGALANQLPFPYSKGDALPEFGMGKFTVNIHTVDSFSAKLQLNAAEAMRELDTAINQAETDLINADLPPQARNGVAVYIQVKRPWFFGLFKWWVWEEVINFDDLYASKENIPYVIAEAHYECFSNGI